MSGSFLFLQCFLHFLLLVYFFPHRACSPREQQVFPVEVWKRGAYYGAKLPRNLSSHSLRSTHTRSSLPCLCPVRTKGPLFCLTTVRITFCVARPALVFFFSSGDGRRRNVGAKKRNSPERTENAVIARAPSQRRRLLLFLRQFTRLSSSYCARFVFVIKFYFSLAAASAAPPALRGRHTRSGMR